jgi:hypothetical protein
MHLLRLCIALGVGISGLLLAAYILVSVWRG